MSSPRRPATAHDEALNLKLMCMDNLLASSEIRIYFKDVESRFLLVSAGCAATVPEGHTLDELLGKTDFDFYSAAHATAAFNDEQEILRTGQPIEGILERETFQYRPDAWVATSKMPLFDNGKIVGTFGITRDVTAQVKAEKALSYQVLHDPVTGLANRISFMDRLKQASVSMERQPGRLAVLFVDLDHFKEVNDTCGHDAGDQLLAEVGRRLLNASRRTDTVARLGGDEFVVLCPTLRDDDDITLIAHRVVDAMRAPFVRDGHELMVTCSVGIMVTDDPNSDPEVLIRAADEAMYEAKASGRNRLRVYDPSQHLATTATRLRGELADAIEKKQLFLLYQPLFSLENQTLVGVEALIRWQHPERGLVVPDAFIPFAENHELIARIDAFVIEEACSQLASWSLSSAWPSAFSMAINVSGRGLAELGFVAMVDDTIRRHALSPSQVCLEISEASLVGAWTEIQETLAALSALGVRIALDDFGTGCSSLAHLQQMKVDIVKIDRSFVEHIGRSDHDRKIVEAVTAMSHAPCPMP